jgi:hypothetical protein
MSGRQGRNALAWCSVAIAGIVTCVTVSCSSVDRRFADGAGGKDSGGGTAGGHSGRSGTAGASGRQNNSIGNDAGLDGDGGSSGSDDDSAGSGGTPVTAGAGGNETPSGGASGTGGAPSAAGSGGKSGTAGGSAGGAPSSAGGGGKANGGSGGTPSVAGAGSGGTPSSAGSGGAGDLTAPTVVSVTPTGTGVTKNTAIVVKFSESMKTSTANPVALTSGGSAVALNAGLWSANNTTLTLQPTSELAYAIGEDPLTAKSYTITVQTSAQDAAGNALTSAYTSSFSTLRRLQTLVTAIQQDGYFDAESTYAMGQGATFYVARQVGGNGYEDQYTHGSVGFSKTDSTLTGATASAESIALELYATTALSGATVTFYHINSADLTNVWTTLLAPKPTTSIALTTFPGASSWWSVDLMPVFKHASFNLASYYALQFLVSMEAATGTAAGVTKTVTFAGGNATSNKPRIRVTRLIP